LKILRKTVKKLTFQEKSDQNKWYFTWRPIYIYIYFYHISLISS